MRAFDCRLTRLAAINSLGDGRGDADPPAFYTVLDNDRKWISVSALIELSICTLTDENYVPQANTHISRKHIYAVPGKHICAVLNLANTHVKRQYISELSFRKTYNQAF